MTRQQQEQTPKRDDRSDELARVSRVLQILAAGKRAAAHARGEDALVRETCRAIVESGECSMAWIGYAAHARRKGVELRARWGGVEDYFRQLKASWAETAEGGTPMGTAIRTGMPVVVEDVESDPRFERWRRLARRHGYASCVCLPLQIDGVTVGALAMYAAQAARFGAESLSVLCAMADQLSSKIAGARLRAEHERVTRAWQQSLTTLGKAEELARIGTWTFDPSSRTIACSAGLRRLLGLGDGDARELREILEFFPAEERESMNRSFAAMAEEGLSLRHEHRILSRRGEARVLLFHGEPTFGEDGNAVVCTGFAQDITERRRYEEHIEHVATHDALTALPNRAVLGDRISQAIASAGRRGGERPAVLRINLDRLAVLIGGLGHSFGDEVVKAVATRLRAQMRDGDTLASLGGDDFVVVLQYARRPEDALRVARRLQDAFAEPFRVRGREIYATCSIGASLYPEDGRDTEALLKNADAALQRVRASGGNGVQFYTPDLGQCASQRIRLEAALRRALDHAQFELHYQPQIELKSGRVCGAEALLRWRHPELGLVPPGRFVALAEETGLIVPIGRWVLEAAAAQNRRWREAGLPAICMAVNVSAKQFARGDLEQTVAGMRAREDFAPGDLEFEVTEGMVMHDLATTSARLKRLQSLGVIVSIDDFGTGYSSLAYLRRLPLDRLKIDQSFVRDIGSGKKAQRLVREIIDLAHALGFGVIAEGVENQREADFLQAHGCDAAQGYFFARPMAAGRFESLLKKRSFRPPGNAGSGRGRSA